MALRTNVEMQILTALKEPITRHSRHGGWRVDVLAEHVRVSVSEMAYTLEALMVRDLVVRVHVDGFDPVQLLSWRWYPTAKGLHALRAGGKGEPA